MTPSWDLLLGGVFVALFVAVALYAVAIPEGDRRWWLLAGALAVLVLASVAVAGGVLRQVLLDAAAFVAVAMVWTRDTAGAKRAARTYLGLLVLAVVCIFAGLYLAGALGEPAAGGTVAPPAAPLDRLAIGLLVAGFALKLALVPFYVWLPGVAEFAAPMTAALIISVVDIAAFGELANLREVAPWVFGQASGLWIAIALLSMFGGALLALAQRDLKRMLAYSTIDDMGYLLLGVVAGGVGLTGALIGALSHALFKVVLFGAVGVAEAGTGQPVDLDNPASRGLLARYPVSGVAFIVGMLGMLGVPPLIGFAGRWRLYLAGMQFGGVWLAVAMAVATGLALLYYVRAAHRVWFGAAPAAATEGTAAEAATKRPLLAEPRLAAVVLALLAVCGVVLGLIPGILTGLLP